MILHHKPLKSQWQTTANICSHSCAHREAGVRLARLPAVGCVQTCFMCLSSLKQSLPEAGSCGKKQEMRWRAKLPPHLIRWYPTCQKRGREQKPREGEVHSFRGILVEEVNICWMVINHKVTHNKWCVLTEFRKVNSFMKPMVALQPELPSPITIPQNWHIIIIDSQDCFFNIPLHPLDRGRFTFSLPYPNHIGSHKRFQ